MQNPSGALYFFRAAFGPGVVAGSFPGVFHACLANVWAVSEACLSCGCCGRGRHAVGCSSCGRSASVWQSGVGLVQRSGPGQDIACLAAPATLRTAAVFSGHGASATKTCHAESLGGYEKAQNPALQTPSWGIQISIRDVPASCDGPVGKQLFIRTSRARKTCNSSSDRLSSSCFLSGRRCCLN